MVLVEERSKEAVAFGKRLRELRLAADMTLESLATAAGMAQQNIARFESGRRSPSWESLLRLAEALGVRLDAFQPVEAEEPAAPPAEANRLNDGKKGAGRPGAG